MIKLKFNIKTFEAISQGLTSKEDWIFWANNNYKCQDDSKNPTFELIKPMMRRRMSHISKLCLQAALKLTQNEEIQYIVFSSRHGELARAVKLIQEINNNNDASPTDFSQSVHNSSAGLFTIASAKKIPVSSIGAGYNTLFNALIEVICYLEENPSHKVLLVDFDAPIPDCYETLDTKVQNYNDYALAMIIESGDDFTLSCDKGDDSINTIPYAFSLIDFLVTDQKTLVSLIKTNKKWKLERS